MLRNPARLAGRDIARADRIEQRRLPVIDMAHDRDHGRPGDQGVVVVDLALEPDFDVGLADTLHLVAELLDHQLRGIRVDRLRDGGHRAHFHQTLHHLGAAHGHPAGELLDGDRFGNHDLAHHGL